MKSLLLFALVGFSNVAHANILNCDCGSWVNHGHYIPPTWISEKKIKLDVDTTDFFEVARHACIGATGDLNIEVSCHPDDQYR